MTAYIALLRAVNVGGTGKLAMADLKALCDSAGFEKAKTYIQSGNVVFASKLGEAKVKATLEAALTKHMGKPVGVLVRSQKEMKAVIAANPFPKAPGNRVTVSFLDKPATKTELDGVTGQNGEEIKANGREVYVRYTDDGMADSKLKLPFAKHGTARNMNTVAKLAAIAGEI